MNSFVQQHFEVFKLTQGLRVQLMGLLTDDDLDYSPGGANLTFGALCREMGEITYNYIQSFKTFKLDFSYHNDDPALVTSVAKLSEWLDSLEQELNATIEGLSEQEIQRPVDRGGGFVIPAGLNAHIYREAILVFCSKASVYLKALNKPLPHQWQTWIG